MGKKRTGGNPRLEVKKLDREILKLANQRAKAWLDFAQSADYERIEMHGAAEQLTAAIVSSNPGPLSESAVTALFRELCSGCQALVKKVRIAFLGPEQSYSYLAALQQFGSGPELIPLTTIEAVFEEVSRGNADFGVVPLENSTDGRIADTLTMFVKTPLKICGEIPFAVHHCLLAKGERTQIKQICSKPQALSQCRGWIAKHFPLVQQVPVESTSAAAKSASKDESVAAIASEQAAAVYGLSLIARNIEDNATNVTRFAVIGQEAAKRTGKDKTALMFEILHQPGSLADVLNVFKRAKLNMTWIESFPMPNLPNEYLFFVEIEGHQLDARIRKALNLLETKTARLVILGSYPGK